MVTTKTKPSAKLLTPKQKQACEKILAAENADSPRAKALLAIQNGATQAAAAVESGLSLGQVKYWLARFRQLGVSCFSAELTPPSAALTTKKSVDKPEKTKKAEKNKKAKPDKKKNKDNSKDKKSKDKDKKTKKKKNKSKKK